MNPDESQTPETTVADGSVAPEEQSKAINTPQSAPEAQTNTSALLDSEVDFLAELEQEIAQVESDTDTNLAVMASSEQQVAQLQSQKQALQQEIANLQTESKVLKEQFSQTQRAMGQLVQEALLQLEQRKQALQIAVEQLERRQERIRTEMRTTFAGVSQEIAIRVQGFKDYLTGSLQDLAAATEQLELLPKAKEEQEKPAVKPKQIETPASPTPQFGEQRFQSTAKQIRNLIDEYRTRPDYYGPPWQLRRTFEPVHAERVANWFFTQGGRGALRTMGSRLQNTLIASAVISVLYTLHEDRLQTLILANSPERLGDWRRGLQDCLGISRADFGPERGIVLFETAEALAVKAERAVKANQMPLIIVDDSEDKISLSLLQFPLWLAFAPDPQRMTREYEF